MVKKMECLPNELYSIIFSFLSLKEKIIMREVSRNLKLYVKNNDYIRYILRNIFTIEKKTRGDLILPIHNNNFLYSDINYDSHSGVHTLFRITKPYNIRYKHCINADCSKKMLGVIYCSKKKLPLKVGVHTLYQYDLYVKRTIPYCINCFNTWN